MSRIQSKNTTPEKTVRSLLHQMGYRFRLHRKKLSGKPDIILPKYKSVVFVHGCFWHRHKNCKDATTPKSNTAFWKKKFKLNVERDKKNQKELHRQGWKLIIIWQCEIIDLQRLALKLKRKLII
ncbi:very short patch repair protein [bacterium BMS3Abin10]|nr:very short patch repair protein [bacterium BMS3Abin10]GBE39532.1 very short patch repair protein [bacterium BMS3Bbin08]